MMNRTRALFALGACLLASAASAQERMDDDAAAVTLKERVIIGTRIEGRSITDSPVPVDLIKADEMLLTGQLEVGRAIQRLIPSFNFSSSTISDGTDAVRPATLRGMQPDQVLVLVNGKRRHASALIHVNTSVGRGTAGTDINAIPLGAIERVEVLRDGASAQYGSDAIAGVINVVLKDDREGGLRTNWGTTYSGDGDQVNMSVDKGFAIGHVGTLHTTFEYRQRDRTNRAGLSGAVQYPDTETCALNACTNTQLSNKAALSAMYPSSNPTVILRDPGDNEQNFNRRNFRVGDADSEQFSGALSYTQPLDALWDGAELYAFADVSRRTSKSGGFYRRANQSSNRLDRNPPGSLYPDGFLPLINNTIWDFSFGSGVTREFENGLKVDLGVVHGGNTFNFEVTNSHNASWITDTSSRTTGPASSSADAGDLELYLTTVNLDFSLPDVIRQSAHRRVNMAWGMEYRRDNYRIGAGEEYSYENYDPDRTTPGPVAGGIQVFPGFRPSNAVNESRHAVALYADAEIFLSEWFMASPAVRYEHYSDFGQTINGKLAMKADLADWLSVRGSASSGFRAPSMQQLYFNNVSTQFNPDPDDPRVTIASEVGTFRNDSAIARQIGIPELKQETSTNLSGGFVYQPSPVFTLTTDFYRIQVNDRIIVSGRVASGGAGISSSVEAALTAAGVGGAQFFMNAVDTETRGMDVVASWDVPAVSHGDLRVSLLGAIIETRVTSVNLPAGLPASLFSAQDRSIIETWQPRSRFTLSGVYHLNRLSAQAQLHRYGSYTVIDGDTQRYRPKYVADIQVSYDVARFGMFKIGANNLFDVTPDRNTVGQVRGGTIIDRNGNVIVDSPGVFQYSRRSAPFGFNGGFYYVGYEYKF